MNQWFYLLCPISMVVDCKIILFIDGKKNVSEIELNSSNINNIFNVQLNLHLQSP